VDRLAASHEAAYGGVSTWCLRIRKEADPKIRRAAPPGDHTTRYDNYALTYHGGVTLAAILNHHRVRQLANAP